MSLRARLALYLVLVVVLPLSVAALGIRAALHSDLERRAGDRLGLALLAVSDRAELIRMRAADVAQDLATRSGDFAQALLDGDAELVQAVVEAVAAGGDRADVVIVLDSRQRVLASMIRDPAVAAGEGGFPRLVDLVEAARAGETGTHLLGSVRPVVARRDGSVLGHVLAGRWVDSRLARMLQGSLTPDVTLLVADRLVGGTVGRLDAEVLPEPGGTRLVAVGGGEVLARSMAVGDFTVVASEPTTSLTEARTVMDAATLALLAVVVVGGGVLSLRLARSVTGPLERLEEAARALAGGDLDQHIDVRGGREVRSLAGAFNAMAATLRGRLTELHQSHEALRRSLSWLGQTLSSSLDLDRTLVAVVDAAVESLRAERGALYMLRPGRRELYVKVARDLPDDVRDARVPIGQGRVGRVAATGAPLTLAGGGGPRPAAGEPDAPVALLVPLRDPQGGEVIGVLALFGRPDGRPFSSSDLETLRSLASQASVAIENVRLHRATEQASVTDSLTGLWNLRYFEQRVEEEVERASRFGHDLGLLVADLDRFKDVNDRFGHPAGDRVLVEVARRMGNAVREVDTLARVGGEELVVVLPETELDGAVQTAERIRQEVAASPIDTGSGAIIVTLSVGVATFPAHGTSAGALFQAADEAMYAAKAGGRDRVAVAGGGRRSGVGAAHGQAGEPEHVAGGTQHVVGPVPPTGGPGQGGR